MVKQPRISVIGSGYWGKNLVRNFHALGALECVCDVNEAALERVTAEFKVRTTRDVDALLKDPLVDAVVIAAPAAQHYRIACRRCSRIRTCSSKSRLPCMPVKGRNWWSWPRERGRILMVGHILEYHPAIIELKRTGAAGRIGQDSVHLFLAPESGEAAHRRKYSVELRAARHFRDSLAAGRRTR